MRPLPWSFANAALPPSRQVALAGMLALALALTSGCASVMRVDSEVQTHTQWPASAALDSPVSYAFERLPSQTTGPAAQGQAELEKLTEAVLARRGWRAVAAATSSPPGAAATSTPVPWRVQVSASSLTLPRAPWDEPRDGLWPRWGLRAGTGGAGLGMMFSLDMPYHQRSVSLVVRDGRTGQIAYETTARHDGRWNSTPALWQAMIEAALTGFPQPAAAAQTVNIDIPR